MTPEQINKVFGCDVTVKLKMRSDSDSVAEAHGREILRQGVFESVSVFRVLGARLTVMDAIRWTGTEIEQDLNSPIHRTSRGVSMC